MSDAEDPVENLPAKSDDASDPAPFASPIPGPSPKALIHQYQEMIYSGPIPPAEVLEKYNSAFEGGAKAVFDMAVREQIHRHQMDKDSVAYTFKCEQEQTELNRLGLYFGYGIATTGLIICLILGLYGQPWLAGAIGIADLSVLVGLFIRGSNSNVKQIPPPKEKENQPPQ